MFNELKELKKTVRVLKGKLTNIEKLLICPQCKSELLFTSEQAECTACGNKYKKYMGFWDFRL